MTSQATALAGRRQPEAAERGGSSHHKLLGVDVSRVSELLEEDIARFLKLSNENIKENAKGSFGDVQSRSFSATKENVVDGEASGVGNNPREKRV